MSVWLMLLIAAGLIVGAAYVVRWAIDKPVGACLDCLDGAHGRCGGCGCSEGGH